MRRGRRARPGPRQNRGGGMDRTGGRGPAAGLVVLLQPGPDSVAHPRRFPRWFVMKPRAKGVRRTALEILEEAVHLLRSAPAGALAAYLTGSVPFLLGLLYFFADMSRNAFAGEHLLSASLILA